MELKNIKIKKNNYTFICEYWETSRAWGHKVTLFLNNIEIASEKIRYYNRTWEAYTFQSCLHRTIEAYEENMKSKYIDRFKYINNIDRFQKGQKAELLKEWQKTDTAKDIEKIKKCIHDRKFN